MIHHLIRIVLIGCVQIILSTGVCLATDHKIAEIIRNKVEQIRSTQTLQIDDAQIASITVLPELYENNGFQRLWTNSQNVEDLFNVRMITTLRKSNNYDPGSVPAPLLIPRF